MTVAFLPVRMDIWSNPEQLQTIENRLCEICVNTYGMAISMFIRVHECMQR